jgi:hypothetical protein
MVEERPLEPKMLTGQVPTTLTVVDHEYAQVLVGQK